VAGVQVAGEPAAAGAEQAIAAEQAASAPAEASAVEAAAPSQEVAGFGTAAPAPSEEVAGIQVPALGVTLAGLLPATGEPVTLFGFGMLALAGVGLAIRRIRR
jgi:hypothetical protein